MLDAPDREDLADNAARFIGALSNVLNLSQLAGERNDRRDQLVPAVLEEACDDGITMAELSGGRAPGRLVLTPYHSAKGREFSAVVLPGLVEQLVPFYFASTGISTRDLERARRLFYVAVTRAIDAVVLIPGNVSPPGDTRIAPDGLSSLPTSSARSAAVRCRVPTAP